MESLIDVSAAIVTYNAGEEVCKTIESVLKFTKKYKLSLSVYDNSPNDETVNAVKKIDGVNVVSTGGNLGFGKANNFALKNKLGKYHAVINPDVILSEDTISALVDFMEKNPDVVMATPKVLNSDGTIQHLPKKMPTYKYLFLGRLAPLGGIFKKTRDEYTMKNAPLDKPTDIEFCTGCFFVIRSDVFEKLGGFDENFFMYLEDADIALRAKQFGRVVYYPETSITHLWDRKSAKSLKFLLIHLKSCRYFFKKWRKKK